MRKLLCSLSLIILAQTAFSQTIATFETPALPKKDTAYINYSSYGKDVGFSNGLAYFPCMYDTSFGYEFWASGFAYSNWTDSMTSGFGNQYSAKTAGGFAGSSQYAVAYGKENNVILTGKAMGMPVNGFYVTNNTYAFNSMRDGDTYAKKFRAADKDFFRLDVFGYRSGTLTKDSVSFYLADFRNTDTTKNYIVRDWIWVDLLKLGKVDSLYFRLQSSDNGSFGMNTPAYFCMDHFITNETNVSVSEAIAATDLRVYPNPASDRLFIESSLKGVQQVQVMDAIGRNVAAFSFETRLELNTANYAPGVYLLVFRNGTQSASMRFVKQ